MSPLSGKTPRRLVSYRIDNNETAVEAVLTAFGVIDPEIRDETVLNDWVNCDSLNAIYRGSNGRTSVSTVIWDHPTTITADAVTIYAPDRGENTESAVS